jgi:hypothetical protein
MSSVLDLVAASITRAPQHAAGAGSVAAASSAGVFGGSVAAFPAIGGAGVEGGLPLPSEELWDEGQYSGFAVEAFVNDVLGVSVGRAAAKGGGR